MSTVRTTKDKNHPYFMLDRTAVNDGRLSYKAIGILTYLLSKPDNWITRETDLINQHADGREAVQSGLKELKELGYIKRVCIRSESGQILRWEVQVSENPKLLPDEKVEDSQNTGNPYCSNNGAENKSNQPVARIPETRILGDIESTEEDQDKKKKKKKENKEKTLSERGSDGVRPTNGFNLSGGAPKRSTKIESWVNLLYEAIHKSGNIKIQPKLLNWESSVRKFILASEMDFDEFEKELNWYVKHIDEDQYTPQAYSAQTFCDKFVQIRNARKRWEVDHPPEPVRTPIQYGKSGMTPEQLAEWAIR